MGLLACICLFSIACNNSRLAQQSDFDAFFKEATEAFLGSGTSQEIALDQARAKGSEFSEYLVNKIKSKNASDTDQVIAITLLSERNDTESLESVADFVMGNPESPVASMMMIQALAERNSQLLIPVCKRGIEANSLRSRGVVRTLGDIGRRDTSKRPEILGLLDSFKGAELDAEIIKLIDESIKKIKDQ